MSKNKISKEVYEIGNLPLEVVIPDPNQPRSDIDEEKIKGLAESIKEQGLLQPILVRPIESGKYQIVLGERRYRACKRLGLETIRAKIRELDDKQVLEIQIVENLQREDLNSIDEAKAFKRMVDDLGYTHEKIAERIGKSREYVTNKLRLLKLPSEIQDEIRKGKKGNIKESHARLVLSVDESDKQKQLAEKIINEKLTVKKTEQFLRSLVKVSRETYVSSGIEKIPLLISFDSNIYSALEQVSNEKRLRKEFIVSNVVSDFLQKEGYLRTNNPKQITNKVECK